jgi:hypothetical protein
MDRQDVGTRWWDAKLVTYNSRDLHPKGSLQQRIVTAAHRAGDIKSQLAVSAFLRVRPS